MTKNPPKIKIKSDQDDLQVSTGEGGEGGQQSDGKEVSLQSGQEKSADIDGIKIDAKLKVDGAQEKSHSETESSSKEPEKSDPLPQDDSSPAPTSDLHPKSEEAEDRKERQDKEGAISPEKPLAQQKIPDSQPAEQRAQALTGKASQVGNRTKLEELKTKGIAQIKSERAQNLPRASLGEEPEGVKESLREGEMPAGEQAVEDAEEMAKDQAKQMVKKEVKAVAKKAVVSLVTKNPWVILVVLGVIAVVVLLIVLIRGACTCNLGVSAFSAANLAGVCSQSWAATECIGTNPSQDLRAAQEAQQRNREYKYGTEKHQKLAKELEVKNIHLSSSGECASKNDSTCTSLDGMQQLTVDGIVALQEAYGGGLMITGGTETGHLSGHTEGRKFDLRDSLMLSEFIHKQDLHEEGVSTYDGSEYKIYRVAIGDYTYRIIDETSKEGQPHWDFEVISGP